MIDPRSTLIDPRSRFHPVFLCYSFFILAIDWNSFTDEEAMAKGLKQHHGRR